MRLPSLGLKGKNVNVKLHSVFQQLALGAGIGIAADTLVEVGRVPVLNDTGTFGNADVSNFDLFFYGIAIAGIAAGIIDIGTGKGILTFSRNMIFYLVGLIIGVYFYDNTLAHIFNIRKFNPYQLVGKYVPPVLPAGTDLPFISPTGQPEPLDIGKRVFQLPDTSAPGFSPPGARTVQKIASYIP